LHPPGGGAISWPLGKTAARHGESCGISSKAMKSHLKAERRRRTCRRLRVTVKLFKRMLPNCCISWCIRSIRIADVFLRELLSNAADACEKLRYEALADPALAPDSFAIRIALDKNAPKPRHRGQWDRHVASRSHRSSRHDRAFGNEGFFSTGW